MMTWMACGGGGGGGGLIIKNNLAKVKKRRKKTYQKLDTQTCLKPQPSSDTATKVMEMVMIIEVVTVKVIVEAKTKLHEKRENNLKKETHLGAQKTIIDIFWAHYPCSPLSLSRKNKQTQGSRHEAS